MAVNENAIVGSIAVPLCVMALFVVVYFFYYIFFPPVEHLFPPESDLAPSQRGYPLSQGSEMGGHAKVQGHVMSLAGHPDAYSSQGLEPSTLGFGEGAKLSSFLTNSGTPAPELGLPYGGYRDPLSSAGPVRPAVHTTPTREALLPQSNSPRTYPTSSLSTRTGQSSMKLFPEAAQGKKPSYNIPPPAPYPTQLLSPTQSTASHATGVYGAQAAQRSAPTAFNAASAAALERSDSVAATSARRGRLPVPPGGGAPAGPSPN